ncbi:MAG TPA: DUF4082 domain-containing protein [Verrucomicrobiae bacterium]|nr:DUF4082 domain-containing protein [Verrucomicrobiae bacterium]
METYTFWNNTIPSGTSSVGAGVRTDGIQFFVSQTCQLTAIGYWLPAGGTTTGSSYSANLWTTTTGNTGTLVSGPVNGSGTWATSAWNWISLGTPVTLSTGTTYVAALTSADELEYYHGYWGTGNPGASGVTSGPLTAPGVATAAGGIQQPTVTAANAFPNNVSSGGTWYGVDIQVSVTTGSSSSGLFIVGIV